MNKITPSDENGYCEYACREEYSPVLGVVVKCDYTGTCEYKSERGKTSRKKIYTCNNIKLPN